MDLGELIEKLSAADPETVVPIGFSHPHSYRGYYEQVAFVPESDTTAGAMLAAAQKALGSTHDGWKGGKYTMHEFTECWMAEVGCCGETIGPYLLLYMLGTIERDEVSSSGK